MKVTTISTADARNVAPMTPISVEVRSASPQRTDCTTGADLGGAVDAAAGEPFSYDSGSDTYKFVWKAPKSWSGRCGTLTVALVDGQAYDLAIRFKP